MLLALGRVPHLQAPPEYELWVDFRAQRNVKPDAKSWAVHPSFSLSHFWPRLGELAATSLLQPPKVHKPVQRCTGLPSAASGVTKVKEDLLNLAGSLSCTVQCAAWNSL